MRGGGLRGIGGVLSRTWKLLRALGLKGVIARIRASGAAPRPAVIPDDHHPFPAPIPADRNPLRVGIVAHMFYPDLAGEFSAALSKVPVPFALFVSVTDSESETTVRDAFSRIDGVTQLEIVRVPNRGRDIAPLLVTFRDQVLGLDVIGHLHTKKSLYTGSAQNRWRTYLVDALFGSQERIEWQLGMFAAEPKLGLIYPESHETVPLTGHTWLSNVAAARTVADRLGVTVDPNAYLDFPAGSMFWARVDAIRPLLDLNLTLDAFPVEAGQLDGTLQHAIERLFVATARAGGFLSGVLPQDGTLALSLEGQRNWHSYFASPLADRIEAASIDAALVSLDVFDTLVQRPFLTAQGARAYLARLVETALGVTGFADLRDRAEAIARHRKGCDPTLGEIYDAIADLRPGIAADALLALELDTERRLLAPRSELVRVLGALRGGDCQMVALSDMYISGTVLSEILPSAVARLVDRWYVSCDTGARKDEGSAWRLLVERERLPLHTCVHVGDNEHSDIQQPHSQGMQMPVHVLRASALLDVVPALRPLRIPAQSSWSEQLRVGLIANHFSDIADSKPECFLSGLPITPRTFGYVALGPIVLDYVTWLADRSAALGIRHLLFLSREGYLLSKVFERFLASPGMRHPELRGSYFLASRQATGFAAMHSREDLALLLDGSFNGTLGDLLSARLGEAASEAISEEIGVAAMHEPVFLPEMLEAVRSRIAPAEATLLELAASARAMYQACWRETVGAARPMIADIGYAGTIQRNLARVLGHPVDGAYFALDTRARSRLRDVGDAYARYYDGRHETGHSTILRHDLLLESVLTAPHPQFTGFEQQDGKRTPCYAVQPLDEDQWAVVEDVHAGALAFVDAALSAAGCLASELAFDPTAVQAPIECLGSGRWAAPWLARIGVDDAFTGRGRVAAAVRSAGS